MGIVFAVLDLLLPLLKTYFDDKLDIFTKNNGTNIILVILSIIAIAWSVIFSFLLYSILTPPMKTKDPLSAKTLHPKRLELF